MTDNADGRDRVRSMFVEYQRTRDRRLRNDLIERHLGLAVHLAGKFANRGEPLDDLVQVAQVGMLKAVERFDPDRGFEFASFARVTVEGELKRHFRDRTWSVHVPRRSQELHLRMRTATSDLAQRLRHVPTVDELAEELGATEEEILEAMEAANAYRSASIEASQTDGNQWSRLDKSLGVLDAGYESAELRDLLGKLIEELPERDRRIVKLRFFEELTQSEIAEQVGISQMHVSRLLSRTLERLRVRMQAGEFS